MEELIGKQLGAFQIVEPLGEGGMASVYKAYQPQMDRYVALKVLPRYFSENPEFVSRFKLEARAIAKLEHPHVLPVHDFGESDGYTYLAMRLVDGGDLSDLLKKKRKLPLNETSRIISQVGGALDYAHGLGVVHRDIKPQNILIDKLGNCLLTDFGIAKLVEATTHLTHTGGILGTPSYVSPEQGTGRPIDNRTDIYSLGVVLFQMVVGKLPYKADTPMGVVFQHCYDPIPIPRANAPELPESVERVILKALAKDPGDRFSSAGEMVKSIREAVETPSGSEPVRQVIETSPEMPVEMKEPPPPEPLVPEKPAAPVEKFPDDEETMLEPAPPKAGRKLPWLAAVAVVLMVAAAAAWFWVQKIKPPAPAIISLFVETEPKNATVKLLNNDKPFYQGIKLKEGRYHVEVSAEGYDTEKRWVNLDTSKEKRIDIYLKRSKTISNSFGMKFVYIPVGTFIMGCPSDELGRDNDEKQHQITLSKGFYMQSTEVTQGQWKAVMRSNPSYFKNCGDDCPVEQVSWNDVQEFIRKLNKQEDGEIYRLPSEAEWEYTCRADSKTAFSNGNISILGCGYDANLDTVGWYCGNSLGKTHKIAQKAPNSWGLYDMHGNVYELCQDLYSRYPSVSIIDSIETNENQEVILKGGSWRNLSRGCRSADRSSILKESNDNVTGFRLVRNP